MPRLSFFFVAITFALMARAEEETSSVSNVSIGVTDHAIFSNAEDSTTPGGPKTSQLMHEAAVRAEYARYRFGIQFTNRYVPGDRDRSKAFKLEKQTVAYEGDDWDVKLGDSYQELGRGIALSLYRDPVFGLDTTVRGAAASYRPSGWSVGVFGGQVNALKFPVAISPTETSLTRNDLALIGASASVQVAPSTKVGQHYLFAANKPLDSKRYNKMFHTVGASIDQEGVWEDADLYLESNALFTRTLGDAAQTLPTGYGSYGSISWSPTPWKTKLEVKDYRKYGFEFRRPPTLEEDIIESVNISEVSASRLYAEHRLGETGSSSVFGSYLVGQDRLVGSSIHHGVIGTRFHPWNRTEIELKGGYRTLPGKTNLSHAAIKGKWKTFPGQMVELGFRKQFSNLNLETAEPIEEDRNIYELGYTFSENVSTSVGYEYIPTNFDEVGTHFANAGATYKMGNLVARGFVGKTSGGTVCSGGVCRQVPPYTGALVETTLSF